MIAREDRDRARMYSSPRRERARRAEHNVALNVTRSVKLYNTRGSRVQMRVSKYITLVRDQRLGKGKFGMRENKQIWLVSR